MRGGEKSVALEGHVKEPGTYVLAENMTLYDIIFAKGGFDDVNYRNATYLDLGHIFRKRPGEVSEKVLTFNLGGLLAGNQKDNIPLLDADRIRVYEYTNTNIRPHVTIGGLVKKPDRYPMTENLSLEDLLVLAGGLVPNTYKVEAQITRIVRKEGEQRLQTTDVVVPVAADFASLPGEKRTLLEDFDNILIRHVPDWEPQDLVSVGGEVVFPGNYALRSKDERLSSFIKRAGGLKTEALAEGATLLRRKDIVALARGGGGGGGYEAVRIDLREALARPGRVEDIVLREGDQVFVPMNSGVVEVRGAVRNGGLLQYQKGAGLGYYIDLCGGYIQGADKKNLTVYYPNKTSKKRPTFLFIRLGMKIIPGSVISIPTKREIREEGAGGGDGWSLVEVMGAVRFPLEVKYRAGQKLSYYLSVCGGFRDDADPGLIVVRLPDGTVLDSKGVAPFNPVIQPGSSIQVAFKEIKTEEKK